MKNITVDTTVIIAVVLNEPEKNRLIEITSGVELIAPASVHWEVGNAFSAMFKRKRITLGQSNVALQEYKKIPIRFLDIPMEEAVTISHKYEIYAYDAYLLMCARLYRTPLLTLDNILVEVARKQGISVMEV